MFSYDTFLACVMLATVAMIAFAIPYSIVEAVLDLRAKAALAKAVEAAQDPELSALKSKARTEALDRRDLDTLRERLETVASRLPGKVAKRVLKGTTQNRRDYERSYNLAILLG